MNKHDKNRVRIQQLERLARRLRCDKRLWDEDDRVYNLLGKVLDRRAALRRIAPELTVVGPYSGLTRSELRQSRTCEADWF